MRTLTSALVAPRWQFRWPRLCGTAVASHGRQQMPDERKEQAPEDTVHGDRGKRNLLEQMAVKRSKHDVVRVLEKGAH